MTKHHIYHDVPAAHLGGARWPPFFGIPTNHGFRNGHLDQVFAGPPLLDAFGELAHRGSGNLVGYLPSRRTQYARPNDYPPSAMRCVGRPCFFRLMPISARSLDTNLTFDPPDLVSAVWMVQLPNGMQ